VPPLLIDDHLLVRVLAGLTVRPADRARRSGNLWTTGLWYYRASRAVRSPTITGALTNELAGIPEPTRTEAISAITRVPEDIGLLSLRDIVPIMSELASAHRLNLLSLEALGAAVHLGAALAVASENDGPLLRKAAAVHGLSYSTV
jgi:hypothetical protein